jgi:hypothetical protein
MGYVKAWRDWYLRVSAKNKGSWEQYKISQCITLSLFDMSQNESFLIAASYSGLMHLMLSYSAMGR